MINQARAKATDIARLLSVKPTGAYFLKSEGIKPDELTGQTNHLHAKSSVHTSESPIFSDYIQSSKRPNSLMLVSDEPEIQYIKTESPEVAAMEARIYGILREKGYAVPNLKQEGDTLVIEGVKGRNLVDYIRTAFIRERDGNEVSREGGKLVINCNGKKREPLTLQDLQKVVENALIKASEINVVIDANLTDKEKQMLEETETKRLSRFGVPVDENYYGLKMMEALGIEDVNFLDLYKPLEKIQQDAKKRWGQWGFPINPEHIYVDEDGNITGMIDFNHFLHTSTCDLNSCFIDQYMASKGGAFLNKFPSPLYADEDTGQNEALKQTLLQKTASHERSMDYIQAYYVSRIFRATKLMAHKLSRLEKAFGLEKEKDKLVTYDQIADTGQAVDYYLEEIRNSLEFGYSQMGFNKDLINNLYGAIYNPIKKRRDSLISLELNQECVGYLTQRRDEV